MESYNNVLLEELIKMASKKDADAQAELCRRYAEGISVERNAKTAVEWGEKAYSRGRTDIAAYLGNLCMECKNVSAEYITKAIKYYNQGAQTNDIECLCKLSMFYHNGECGLVKDDNKSFELLLQALTKGAGSEDDFTYIRFLLGNAYREGIGVKQNFAEAVCLYVDAALKGYEEANIKLAECYLDEGKTEDAEFYIKKACESENSDVAYVGRELYGKMLKAKSAFVSDQTENLEALTGEKDRAVSEKIRALHDATERSRAFEKEADRLVHNAETLMKIGNYKRVYPAYDRVTYEYPADFRGWYNLARVFTNNFASYSIFPEEKYGKTEEAEFYENMAYAERTVQDEFAGMLASIKNMYVEGCIDISIAQMKNTLYNFFAQNASTDKIAEYVRTYEDKLVYLFEKRPCVVTALSLHLLRNILNNDNIRKYNEKVTAHNNSINAKIDQKIQDYITELAQNLRIDRPKDFASNAEALEKINTDEEYINQVQAYREQLKSAQEYYTEIENTVAYDFYEKDKFGSESAYAGYYPQNKNEFDDEYVDFIVSFADKCGIQMHGYEAFYTDERKNAIYNAYDLTSRAAAAQDSYYTEYYALERKYSEFDQNSDKLFVEIARALVKYEIAYGEYQKANDANVFKQMFKGREVKESIEGSTAMFESAQETVDSIAKSIIASAHDEVSSLNAKMRELYPQEIEHMFLCDESSLDDVIKARVATLKSQHENVQ